MCAQLKRLTALTTLALSMAGPLGTEAAAQAPDGHGIAGFSDRASD